MKRDHAEVGALSGGVTFKPLSIPLQDSIRFFRAPLPARPSIFLAVDLPCYGRDYGLTLFLSSDTSGLDLAYSPVAFASAYPEQLARYPATHLLVQA